MRSTRLLRGTLMAAVAVVAGCAGSTRPAVAPRGTVSELPKRYVCPRADRPVDIDGKLDEAAWRDAAWTDYFVDIEGDRKPEPRFRTRAKMLWDDSKFYIGAEMEEPHVWATLTKRDSVIYHDNDFEVFIDPDGDTLDYYELEVNGLNTAWDLMLTRPYRHSGKALTSWDIKGLETAVSIAGTINEPRDKDEGWSVEIAIPWEALREAGPGPGDEWRVNFSRVEWKTVIRDGKYNKLLDPGTGKPLPEDNWVWSSQGEIDMHRPEMWGYVRFRLQ